MHVDVSQQNGITVVVPDGSRLDAEVAGELRLTLLKLIEQGQRKLIVDLRSVDFIDSSGLGALVSALKRLKQADTAGDIRLANVRPSVYAVLEIIRLNRVFMQTPTVDDAVTSFGATV
jgi:anti-sigma B factor antagonist